MADVYSLKAIVKGPFPKRKENLPNSINLLFDLRLQDLVIHFTGPAHKPLTDAKMKSIFRRLHAEIQLHEYRQERVTVSWNRQIHKQNTEMSGLTYELKAAAKEDIRASEAGKFSSSSTKTLWPKFKRVVSEQMDVGMLQITLGSNDRAARHGMRRLMDAFLRTDSRHTHELSHMKTLTIAATYEADEDE